METAVFIIATAAFLIGVLAIAYEGGARTSSERARTGLYTFAAVAAALAYAVMANGGGFLISQGGLFPAPRYLLWVAVAPVLFVALALTAFPAGQRNVGLTAAVALAASAAFAALGISALTAGLAQWLWFLVALALFGVAAGIVWLPLREYAERGDPVRRETFISLAGATTVLVALDPVIFFFGPNGVGLWGAATSTTLFALADVWLIVGTGLLAVWRGRQLVGSERSERGGAAAASGSEPLGPLSRRPARAAHASTPAATRPEVMEPGRRSAADFADRPLEAGAVQPSFDTGSAAADVPRDARPARFRRQHWAMRGGDSARMRQEWLRARDRLIALQTRSAASPLVRSVAGSLRAGPIAGGIRRLSLDGLGGPPQRLVLGGHAYGLVGRTRGAAAPATGGRPIAAGAEPPRHVALGEFRYRRIDADAETRSSPAEREPGLRQSSAPQAAPKDADQRSMRRDAPASPRTATKAYGNPERRESSRRSRSSGRPKPRPDPGETLARAAIARLMRTNSGSIADLPLHRITPESAVPVAIVAGVLYWVSRPGKEDRDGQTS